MKRSSARADTYSKGILIPTRNNETQLAATLDRLVHQNTGFEILVIDSSSTDRTRDIASDYGVRLHIVPRMDFNHGATRETGRKLLATDIVVMMTADAVASNDSAIRKLIDPIVKGQAAIAYGRQQPRKDADPFEAVPRLFNYPAESQIRSIADISKYGVYTFFCSNSFAAYLNSALDEVGGFDELLTNEDYFAAAKILQKGYRIAYVADALVEHSHKYTIAEDFKRYFDTGYVRAERQWVSRLAGQAEGRGLKLLGMTLAALRKYNLFLLPKAFFVFFVRWLGFRIGYLALHLPGGFNKKLSSQPYYWDSEYYRSNINRRKDGKL